MRDNYANGDFLFAATSTIVKETVNCNTYAPLLNVMMNTARLAIFVKETYVVERKDVITTICVKMNHVTYLKIAINITLPCCGENKIKRERNRRNIIEEGIDS